MQVWRFSGTRPFVEWTEWALKSQGVWSLFIPGTLPACCISVARPEKSVEQRRLLDFRWTNLCTVPVLGGFVRWLYRRFVS